MLDEILEFNKQFVANKGYEKYITNKYPDKKIAILSCMDTRLTELLPAALGIKNGDVKMIKNAGGVISHPFGREEVTWFTDKFDYRNKDKDWGNSKDSIQRCMQKLGGGYPADEPFTEGL